MKPGSGLHSFRYAKNRASLPSAGGERGGSELPPRRSGGQTFHTVSLPADDLILHEQLRLFQTAKLRRVGLRSAQFFSDGSFQPSMFAFEISQKIFRHAGPSLIQEFKG